MLSTKKSERHSKATRTVTVDANATASSQTAQGCRDVCALGKIREPAMAEQWRLEQ